MKRVLGIVICLTLLAGCTVSNLTLLVTGITVAADAALAVLGASGTLPPAIVAIAAQYVGAVGAAVNATSAELASPDTDAEKALKVASIWAAVGFPNLPPNTPPAVTAVLAAIDAAVRALLAALPPPQPTAAVRVSTPTPPPSYRLSWSDRRALSGLGKKGRDIAARAGALRR